MTSARHSASTLSHHHGPSVTEQRSAIFDPRKFGARGDGQTLDTSAIQTAIEAAATCRGIVRLSAGSYLSGTLHLRSGITLALEAGAVLLGSPDRSHYEAGTSVLSADIQDDPNAGWAIRQGDGSWYALLQGYRLRDVKITGPGLIDGNGEAIYSALSAQFPEEKVVSEKERPVLINLVECHDCQVLGVTLRSPACWTQSYLRCEGLRLTDLNVEALVAWNNDGIDICSCRRVSIRGCRINANDDGICLKTTAGPVEDVVISDCIIRTCASGLKFGTASAHDFRNIAVSNLAIYDTARSGITLQSVDGGAIEGITINNVTMRNVGNAIYLRLGDRRGGVVGSISGVMLSNVHAEVTGVESDAGYPFRAPRPDPPLNLLPCAIVGLPDALIGSVSLSNIQIVQRGDMISSTAMSSPSDCDSVPEDAAGYPEYDQFGELPAWGFYLRHVEHVALLNVSLIREGSELRPAIVADDVDDLSLEGCRFTGASDRVYKHGPAARD